MTNEATWAVFFQRSPICPLKVVIYSIPEVRWSNQYGSHLLKFENTSTHNQTKHWPLFQNLEPNFWGDVMWRLAKKSVPWPAKLLTITSKRMVGRSGLIGTHKSPSGFLSLNEWLIVAISLLISPYCSGVHPRGHMTTGKIASNVDQTDRRQWRPLQDGLHWTLSFGIKESSPGILHWQPHISMTKIWIYSA